MFSRLWCSATLQWARRLSSNGASQAERDNGFQLAVAKRHQLLVLSVPSKAAETAWPSTNSSVCIRGCRLIPIAVPFLTVFRM